MAVLVLGRLLRSTMSVGCADVGLENGGWGQILMEARVEKTDWRKEREGRNGL